MHPSGDVVVFSSSHLVRLPPHASSETEIVAPHAAGSVPSSRRSAQSCQWSKQPFVAGDAGVVAGQLAQ